MAGIRENVFLGDGLQVMTANGDISMIYTEAECDAMVAFIEQNYLGDFVGFDTENVAYFGIHAHEGKTSDKTALGQIAGNDFCALFVFHKWASLYPSFARLMANPRILKFGNAVTTDVRKLNARFPTIVLAGVVELSTFVKVAFPDLTDGKLKTMVREILHLHIDKRMDHRLWEAQRYTRRQILYAAIDAFACRRLAQAAAEVRLNATAAQAAPPAMAAPVAGAVDEDEAFEKIDARGAQGERVACTRHQRHRSNESDGSDGDDNDSDDDNDARDDDANDSDDGNGDGSDGRIDIPGRQTHIDDAVVDADAGDAAPAPQSAAGLQRFKQIITDYHGSNRTDNLTFPSSLSNNERKALHSFCDQYSLYHRSIGPGNARVLTVARWKVIQSYDSSVGERAVGALVARVEQQVTHRGHVANFDRAAMRWELTYPTLAGFKEVVDIDVLNKCMKLRYDHDHGQTGLGTAVNHDDDDLLTKLISGIDSDWKTSKYSKFSYDPAHWMRMFASMLAVDKHSDIEKQFDGWLSEALFKIFDSNEYARGRTHCRKLGMTDEQIKRLPRKYWRLRLRYMCPSPEIIIRGLFDIYAFFRDLDDPVRPRTSCLKSDALDIFLKEAWYVQRGLLSDIPGIPTYMVTRRCVTGFVLFRCLKTASPLEGMHFHYRQAQHPSAKSCTLELMHARACVFDFVWNVKASVKARLIPNVGHFHLWLVDALVDIYRGLGVDVPAFFSE